MWSGNLCFLQRRIFVLAARVGELDAQAADIGLVKGRQQRLEADVVDVRTFPVAPADVQPYAVARNALQRLVERGDVLLDDLDEFRVGLVLEQQHPFHRQIRRVDLQDQSGIDHGLVFVVHLAGDRVEILFVGRIMRVEHRRRDDPG